jgi:hypothetical protein
MHPGRACVFQRKLAVATLRHRVAKKLSSFEFFGNLIPVQRQFLPEGCWLAFPSGLVILVALQHLLLCLRLPYRSLASAYGLHQHFSVALPCELATYFA